MAGLPIGAGGAGGMPTAPSIGGQAQPAPAPGPGAPTPEALPQAPEGGDIVMDALKTLTKFGLAQREQGNPGVAEAVMGLVQAMTGGGALPPQEAPIPAEAPPAAPSGPIPGGNIPLNA